MRPARHRSFQLTGSRWGAFTRRMWIGFLLALVPMPAWTIWSGIIRPKVNAPVYEYTVDIDSADAEADYLLHTARLAVQQVCRERGDVPQALVGENGCGLPAELMHGRHYLLVNGIEVTERGELQLVAVPLAGNYPVKLIRFMPAGSSGEVVALNHPN